jgi:tRNA (mo5U34)-methyltransferase
MGSEDERLSAATPIPIQATIDQYIWFHSIDFGNGVVSRGSKDLDTMERETTAYFHCLDLTGRSLLDVGAWNGGVSFAAKRRGAGRLVAADKFTWAHPYLRGRETLELSRSLLGLDIETVEIDVPDLSPETVGSFEIVLFLGVFYHLFDAPTLMKQVSRLATDLFILETHQDALELARPGMVYYPGNTLANDESNFWGPNPECVYEMLRELGFARVFYQDHPNYLSEGSPDFRARGIFHAFRTAEAFHALSPSPGEKPWYDLSSPAARASVFRAIVPQAQVTPAAQLRDTQGALRDAEAALEATRKSRTMRLAQGLKDLLGRG